MITRIPFGAYKNRLLTELDDSYLLWLLTLPDLRDPLLEAIECEADWRMGTVAQPEARP